MITSSVLTATLRVVISIPASQTGNRHAERRGKRSAKWRHTLDHRLFNPTLKQRVQSTPNTARSLLDHHLREAKALGPCHTQAAREKYSTFDRLCVFQSRGDQERCEKISTNYQASECCRGKKKQKN